MLQHPEWKSLNKTLTQTFGQADLKESCFFFFFFLGGGAVYFLCTVPFSKKPGLRRSWGDYEDWFPYQTHLLRWGGRSYQAIINAPIAITPPRFNSEFAPEKWWLEDKPFLLGFGNFLGANSLLNSGRASHSIFDWCGIAHRQKIRGASKLSKRNRHQDHRNISTYPCHWWETWN